MQNTVAGEEIGVGDNHFTLRIGQHLQVMTFNIVPMLLVVPPDKQRLRFAGLAVLFRAMTASPPAASGLFTGQVFQHEQLDVLNHRSLNADRVVLLGLRAVIRHMFGGVVNAAHERHRFVHYDDFAVHAAEQVGAHAEQTRTGIVIAEHHAGGGELINKFIAKIRRAISIEQGLDFYPAPGGMQQYAVQLPANVVFKPDKRFKVDFLLCVANRLKDRRIKVIAVFQQRNTVTFLPGAFHKWISALSGAWSERCRQFNNASAVGLLACAFFT